jgi:hypothetical protein
MIYGPLPGWDSSTAVSKIHENLEFAALVFFGALVALESIAHFEPPRHKLIQRIGLACFGFAVLMEFIAYP